MKILDLFAGIGTASLAAELVWGKENINHIFCDWLLQEQILRGNKKYKLIDGTEISEAKLRVERLKACGNGLVLQNVIEIFKAIKHADENT